MTQPGEDARDVLLSQGKPVGVAGREVADVQTRDGEARDLGGLTRREETVRDPSLVQHLDGARRDPERPRAGQVLTGTPLGDHDGDAGESQFAGQHQSRGAGTIF